MLHYFKKNFLGHTANWYKIMIVGFLLINPLLLYTHGAFITGWVILLEFIITLGMALKCYPLSPGGLIALEAIVLKLTHPNAIYANIMENLPVILLLIFMVAAIYFMQDLLNFLFTRALLKIRSKTFLSICFCFAGALLSAFLDALTVIAVLITALHGIYNIYHLHVTKEQPHLQITAFELEQFRAFLRSLVMHGAIGSALGGLMTLVGEPQNLIIATYMDWDFAQFFRLMLPISLPCLLIGLATCAAVEKLQIFGFGAKLPANIYQILVQENHKLSHEKIYKISVQALCAVLLLISLSLHLAQVGLIGLMILIIITSLTGITKETQLGVAFAESLPFTALLVVFFVIIVIIHEQQLFRPLIDYVLHTPHQAQAKTLFVLNGVLSAISDNVFVTSIYMSEMMSAYKKHLISYDELQQLAIAINAGVNLPSIATPNGQAAFLFLLTSTLAPIIRLSYFRMVWMALPFTVIVSTAAYFLVV